MTPDVIVGIIALLGSAGLGAIITKAMNKPVDAATAQKLHAETQAAGRVSAATEVETIRAVMSELRASEQQKTSEIAELKADMKQTVARVNKLEERERHMLTRAAVHEAWDQMAFSILAGLNPNHPPPPPIVPAGYLDNGDFREDPDFPDEDHKHE